MENLKELNQRIISLVNINLEKFAFDAGTFVDNTLDYEKMLKFFAFYGITEHHPIYFSFKDSNIAGSHFLGKCYVKNSVVYKTDIRGDELKKRDNINCLEDEFISIKNSLLYKTLVHSCSHNPISYEEFFIKNTISAHYANIHGSTVEGCFLGAFATVDLMNLYSCIVGEFSYIQTPNLFHKKINPGTIWIKNSDFEFKYNFNKELLDNYIGINSSHQPRGIIYEFIQQREKEYENKFQLIKPELFNAPLSSAVSPFAVIKENTFIGENVFVAQKAFLDNAQMCDGVNAQENSYIINSKLTGLNVTAHGGTIINSDVGLKVFVGFNSFLNGKEKARIKIGKNCIIMPHTIIDNDTALEIPEKHVVWGFINSQKDIEKNSISLENLSKNNNTLKIGDMEFKGDGQAFINVFISRIEHILEANGACYNGNENQGHGQNNQKIDFNFIQPYSTGKNKGLYPSIEIKP
ncbi:MAG: transferase [Desulfobacteraceae bacterium 4572_130]|nr:MAG: transferase [Desulfobacteraceae bacterium 4572_130]